MHVHANQFNANTQMDAIYAAARAEAKLAAQRTRKKLFDAASAVAIEVDEGDCVVRLSGEDASTGHANQRDWQSQSNQKKQNVQADSDNNPFSDWV